MPLPEASHDTVHRVNAWDFGQTDTNRLTYNDQLGLLQQLQRLAEHYAAAVFSIMPSQAFDASKLVVFGAMAALADHVLRQKAVDRPSIITRTLRGEELNPYDVHMQGGGGGASAPFGMRADAFYRQSESLEIVAPESNVTQHGQSGVLTAP